MNVWKFRRYLNIGNFTFNFSRLRACSNFAARSVIRHVPKIIRTLRNLSRNFSRLNVTDTRIGSEAKKAPAGYLVARSGCGAPVLVVVSRGNDRFVRFPCFSRLPRNLGLTRPSTSLIEECARARDRRLETYLCHG